MFVDNRTYFKHWFSSKRNFHSYHTVNSHIWHFGNEIFMSLLMSLVLIMLWYPSLYVFLVFVINIWRKFIHYWNEDTKFNQWWIINNPRIPNCKRSNFLLLQILCMNSVFWYLHGKYNHSSGPRWKGIHFTNWRLDLKYLKVLSSGWIQSTSLWLHLFLVLIRTCLEIPIVSIPPFFPCWESLDRFLRLMKNGLQIPETHPYSGNLFVNFEVDNSSLHVIQDHLS